MSTTSDRHVEQEASSGSVGRGRDAESPTEIPPSGWKDIFTRVKVEAKDDDATLMAAGVAFYSLLAMVPGLVALISVYGLVATPSDVSRQITSTLSAAPREVRNLVTAQLESITASAGGGAVLGAILGTLIALWSASSGVGHLMNAVNRAYDEEETRGFVRLKLIALALTVGAIVFIVIAFAVIALLPSLLAKTGLGTAGRVLVGLLRWILLMAGMMVGLSVVYRYGPDREDARWEWVSVGAVAASVMWIVGSILFSIYTANFAKYNETYGSLGAVVVLLLWLDLTALAVVLGAEINCEVERQTAKDSTDGPPEPMGSRNAVAADTVGGTASEVKQATKQDKARKHIKHEIRDEEHAEAEAQEEEEEEAKT
jgi:membrane protein